MPQSLTQAEIVYGLKQVGLQAGDKVLVHSSFKAFGPVDGGPQTIINALLDVLTPIGTLVMPTFTLDNLNPEIPVVFDQKNSKSETGIISELFRLRSGVKRSIQISHSIAVMGPQSQQILGDEKSGFGAKSPFDELLKLNAWNLFLGVGFDSCTAIHTAEAFEEVPYRHMRTYLDSKIIHEDGRETASESIGFVRYPGCQLDLLRVDPVFRQRGLIKTSGVGLATLTNIRIRDVVSVTRELLKKDPYWLCKTRPEGFNHDSK